MGMLEETLKDKFLLSTDVQTRFFNARGLLENLDVLSVCYHAQIGSPEDAVDGHMLNSHQSEFICPESGERLFQEHHLYVLENPYTQERVKMAYVSSSQANGLFMSHNVYLQDGETLIHRAGDTDNFLFVSFGSKTAVSILTFMANAICNRVSAIKESNEKDYSVETTCYQILRDYFPEVMAYYRNAPLGTNGALPMGLENDLIYIRLSEVYAGLNDYFLASTNNEMTRVLKTYHYRGFIAIVDLGDQRIFEWTLLNILSGRDPTNLSSCSFIGQPPTATITKEHVEFFSEVAINESRIKNRQLFVS